MSDLELLKCNICGGDLKPDISDTFRCACCGNLFAKKQEDLETSFRKVLGEEKYSRVSAARQNLWRAMHEEYVSSETCLSYARKLKSYVPSDFYANFAEVVNGGNDCDLSKFLNESSDADMKMYSDAVLDFMLKSLTAGVLTAVCAYIDGAYEKSSAEYVKYIDAYEKEAEKVDSGIYELSIERDVFLAYSSADTDKVTELCGFLESQSITCFLSMRNLRHGKGAVDNYDKALKTAMDNCRTVVFLSSESSRSLSCDALRRELPYMRTRDLENAPAEYRNLSYDKLPAKYKKPRVEYLLDDYKNTVADGLTKQIFYGYEWCKSQEEVAVRIVDYLTAMPDTAVYATTADTESSSFAVKEKNVLNQVKRLVASGDFSEAEVMIADLESEEKRILGVCPAAVYYCKILIEYEAVSDDELVEKLVSSGTKLRENKNFRLAKACDDSPERTRLIEIAKEIDDGILRKSEEDKAKNSEEDKRMPEEKNGKEEDLKEEDNKKENKVHKEGGIKSHGNERTEVVQETDSLNAPDTGLKYSLEGDGISVTGMGGCGDKQIVIPSELAGKPVVAIGARAFINIGSIDSAVIPGTVRSIGHHAFSNCASLTDLSCASAEIKNAAFAKCGSLKTVVLDSGVRTVGPSAFRDCRALTRLVVPDSLELIDSGAFSGCVSLKSIFYGGTKKGWSGISVEIENTPVNSATMYWFSKDKPSSPGNFWRFVDGNVAVWGKVVSDEPSFSDEVQSPTVTRLSESEGLEYEARYDGYAVSGIGNNNDFDIVIPFEYNGKPVTCIGRNAFNRCRTLRSVAIPKSVCKICSGAFWGCECLAEITIRENPSTGLGSSHGMPSEPANISWGDKSIGDEAFYGCKSLKSVTIPSLVTAIEEKAFCGCLSLSSITLPETIRSIGENSFALCKALADVHYSGTHADWNGVSVHESNNQIFESVTVHCRRGGSESTGLKYRSEGESYVVAGPGGCKDQDIVIPEKYKGKPVTSIDVKAFCRRWQLTSVIIPDSVTSIGISAFNSCHNLNSVKIPDSVTSIGCYAFYCCSSLTSIKIPDAVTLIDLYTFYGCSSLKKVIIGRGVNKMEKGAFRQCTNLTDVYYCGSPFEWESIFIKYMHEEFDNVKIHYYSETYPKKHGNYWHYDGNGNMVEW